LCYEGHDKEVSLVTLKVRVRPTSGQGLAEYALILALIAIAAVFALLFLSGTISSILSLIGHKL
jgi:pilus assembly protein Flp/PilA